MNAKTSRRRPRVGSPKAAKAVKGKLVRIGNSRGVRLPKAVIEQAGLTEDVEISVLDNQVLIRSAADGHPRAGWEEAIRAVIAEHGDELTDEDREWLDAPIDAKLDDEPEWTW